jgi:hypothetical protein
MQNTVNRESKSVLAKVLACENIIVRHSHQAHTAMFDIRNRVLTLPIFKDEMSNELYDMLVAHEVGHALFTPYTSTDEDSVIKGGYGVAADKIGGPNGSHIAFDYLNAVEDARIDRLMKEKFCGIGRDYRIGYQELYDKNFFGTDGKNIDEMSLIDRINLYFKIGGILPKPIKFNDDEQKFIDRIAKAITFDDVVEIVKDIWAYSKITPPTPEKINGIDGDIGYGNKDDDTGNSVKVKISEDIDGDFKGKSSSEGGEGEKDKEEDSVKTEGIKNDPHATPEHYQGKMPSECMTQKKFTSMQDSLIDKSKVSHQNIIPKANLDKAIVGYKRILDDFRISRSISPTQYNDAEKDFISFKNSSNNSVGILIKQFMMKKAAKDSARGTTSKTGIIDLDSLVNYKFTDDIFLRMKTVKRGKSHGLVFFMDWSGSMAPILDDTLKQMFQIVFFCRKMNIPYKVYAFSSLLVDEHFDMIRDGGTSICWNFPNNEQNFSDFSLLELLNDNMSGTEFNEMMTNLFAIINQGSRGYNSSSYYTHVPRYMGLSGTPLNEAIIAAMDIVPMFKKEKNLDIVHTVFLTDGESNGSWIYGSTYGRLSTLIRDRYVYDMPLNKNTTDCLIEMFQGICNCRAIGIYLDGRRSRGEISGSTLNRFFYNSSNDYLLKQNKMFQDEGFACADPKHHSYAELFILRGNSEVEDVNISDVVKDKKTNHSIRTAFVKAMNKKISSRVMLNRFIDLIAVE